MCGRSVTFSRSPLWAPLGRVVRWFKEDASDRTSGETFTETLESIIITTHAQLDLQCRVTVCLLLDRAVRS